LEVIAKELGVSLQDFLVEIDVHPVTIGVLRHQISDLIYQIDDARTLLELLKLARKRLAS